jgi:catecholate siderophore receptor
MKKLTLYISACISLFAGAAVAEDQIEEVVVLGEVLFQDQINSLKTPTPVINVPQSVVLVSSEEITRRGFTSIGDIVNHVPGLNT